MIRKNSNILVQKSNICNAMISYPDFAHTYSHKHTHSNTQTNTHTHIQATKHKFKWETN